MTYIRVCSAFFLEELRVNLYGSFLKLTGNQGSLSIMQKVNIQKDFFYETGKLKNVIFEDVKTLL